MPPDQFRNLCRHLAALNVAHRNGALPLWLLFQRYAVAFRAYRKGEAMPELRTLRLDPPQPCGVLDPLRSGQICGKPATLATAEAAPVSAVGPAGYLLVLPVCPDCARTAHKLAGVAEQPRSHDVVFATISLALPDAPAPAVLEAAAQLLDENATKMRRDARILRAPAAELTRRN